MALRALQGPAGGAAPVGGSGTTDTIPRWTGATPSTTLTDSLLSQSGAIVTNSGTFRAANGAPAEPAYTFSGSSGTGMYRATSGALLRFAVSGAYAFGVDTNGSVGIGTASPGAQLHVERAGGTSNAEYLRLRNTSSGTGSAVGIDQYVSANTVATGRIQHAWNGTTYDTIFSNWNGSALAEAARTVGGTTPVLSVPSGLKLPATPGNADAQALDCYVDGGASAGGVSWTPTLSAAATWGGTAPTVTNARYTRIGNMVFCTVTLDTTGGVAFSSTYGSSTITAPAGVSAAVFTSVPSNRAGTSANGAQSGTTIYVPTYGSATTVINITWFYAV
jgi:hypothetical protein